MSLKRKAVVDLTGPSPPAGDKRVKQLEDCWPFVPMNTSAAGGSYGVFPWGLPGTAKWISEDLKLEGSTSEKAEGLDASSGEDGSDDADHTPPTSPNMPPSLWQDEIASIKNQDILPQDLVQRLLAMPPVSAASAGPPEHVFVVKHDCLANDDMVGGEKIGGPSSSTNLGVFRSYQAANIAVLRELSAQRIDFAELGEDWNGLGTDIEAEYNTPRWNIGQDECLEISYVEMWTGDHSISAQKFEVGS
jgi:hypothetical protein